MRRLQSVARPDWRAKVEALGFIYHTHENGPYWEESVSYELSPAEVDTLERSTNELHRLCLSAAETVIEGSWWSRLGIAESMVPSILSSWERDDFSLYGRFDLAYDGLGTPKLLEYNADTPTALLEAAVVQWYWLQELHPDKDQFNSLHERLIEAWRRRGPGRIHFAGVEENEEDAMTLLYLRDTCLQAGLETKSLHISSIGWDAKQSRFVDLENEVIQSCFKLYPWEWLQQEDFSQHLEKAELRMLEPSWKMLLSNKALLPILWELFPGHPNLLPAYFEPGPLGANYVKKPFLSREGSNVSIFENNRLLLSTDGEYGAEGYVYQARAPIPNMSGNFPVFGSWVVDHAAAGIGIREDSSLITGNLSRFVPHFIESL